MTASVHFATSIEKVWENETCFSASPPLPNDNTKHIDFEKFYHAFWTWPVDAAHNETIRQCIARNPEYLYKIDSTRPPSWHRSTNVRTAWGMLRARFDPSDLSIPNALLRNLLYPNGMKRAAETFPLHLACDYGAATGLLAVMALRHRRGLRTRDHRGRLPLHIIVQRMAQGQGHRDNGLVARFNNRSDLAALKLFVALDGGTLRDTWRGMTPFMLFCIEGLSKSSPSSSESPKLPAKTDPETQKANAAYLLLRECPDVLIQTQPPEKWLSLGETKTHDLGDRR